MIVVLDRDDAVVARVGDGPQIFLKACQRCDLLVEHIRVTTDYRAHNSRVGRTPLRYTAAPPNGRAPYRYVTAQAHRNRCVADRARARRGSALPETLTA